MFDAVWSIKPHPLVPAPNFNVKSSFHDLGESRFTAQAKESGADIFNPAMSTETFPMRVGNETGVLLLQACSTLVGICTANVPSFSWCSSWTARFPPQSHLR